MADIDIEALRDRVSAAVDVDDFNMPAVFDALGDVIDVASRALDALAEARAEVRALRSADGFVAAVESEAKRYHEAECFYRIERNAARAEATRLTALLHAKEAWIEGAKVDLDGYDAARAALARLTDPDDGVPLPNTTPHGSSLSS